jgi:NADPH:quinone reductase-like Zn-dependent oxidoreductase
MRAVVINGREAEPICTEFAEPQPQPDEQLFSLVGAGLHQIVRALATGAHYSSEGAFPLVPGVDAVARDADGRLVYTGWIRPPWGTMAERMAARLGIDVPADADPLAVAAGMNPAMSAWLPLSRRVAEVDRLGTVMVIGATGMAGRAAIQAAFAVGADRVVGVGRNPEQLAEVEALGAVPVRLGGPDPARAIADALAGEAPSLVLDYVWGAAAEAAFTALTLPEFKAEATGETVYNQVGALGGPTAALPAELLRSRPIRVIGSGLGSVSTQRIVAELPKMIALIADGTITVPYTAYPFERVADAWAHRGPSRAVLVP